MAAEAPNPQVTPDAIFQLAAGFMSAKHLFIANEVGLFEKLSEGPATLDELTRRMGIPRRTARIVADAMAALGFIERRGDLYQNAPVAAAFLSARPLRDMRPFLRFWNQLSYPRWERFEEAIRKGHGVFGALKFTPEEQKVFSEGVEAFSASEAESLAAAYDFGRHRRVLDLGGGTGSFLRVLLQRYAGLECTLFEMPAAAAVARQRLANGPFAERIRIVEGDFLRDPIPNGHDAILLANVVHALSAEHNVEVLRRIREGAPQGGRLLLADLWTDPTHTDPAFAALMAGEFLVMSGEGDVYSSEEACEWFAQTGWRMVEQRPLVGPSSLVVAEAA